MKIKEIAFISSILLILSCVNEDNEKIAVDVNYRESNLPIITINTYGDEIPDEPRIDAYMGIIDNGNVVNKIFCNHHTDHTGNCVTNAEFYNTSR